AASLFAGAPAGVDAGRLQAAAIGFSVSPATQTVTPGQTFRVSLQVDAGGQSVTAAQAVVTFPAGLLEVVDADANTQGTQVTAGAGLASVLVNRANNDAGYLEYAAGVPLGAVSQTFTTFELASVQFRAKAAGTASLVLAA